MPRKSPSLVTLSRLFLTGALISCASISAQTDSTSSEMAKLRDAHRDVLKAMNAPGKDGNPPQLDDKRFPLLLEEGWRLAGDWAAAWLDTHPNPNAKDLDSLFVQFSPPPSPSDVSAPNQPALYAFEGDATAIAPEVYVVSSVYEGIGGTGTFVIMAREASGHFRPMWSIKTLAAKHYASRDEIGRWAYLNGMAYYSGPFIVGQILPLPPAASGQPRFAVEAYQAADGSTQLKQLSIWQWDGSEAKNLLIGSFGIYLDDERSLSLVGNLLTAPTKEETESFSSTGACIEPRGIWTIRITPEKVENLGHTFLQPQIKWASQLLAAAVSKHSNAAVLASPAVLATIRHGEVDANMVEECRVIRQGKTGEFELSFDEGTKLHFTYRLRNGQPYFTSVNVK